MKRFAEQVAGDLEKDDIMDPEVLAEGERRLRSQPFFICDYIRRMCVMTKDCRPDMHEPDEQGLSIEFVHGYGLDNACMGPPHSEPMRKTDAGFWLIKNKGMACEQREWFNLACLIAVVRSGPWR
jgi:hypothetical protein